MPGTVRDKLTAISLRVSYVLHDSIKGVYATGTYEDA